jgi:hypothetical protein
MSSSRRKKRTPFCGGLQIYGVPIMPRQCRFLLFIR